MMAPFPSPTSKWHSTTYATLSPTRPELSAKGKTIVITGGGSGIGAETAHAFAQAGASRIVLLGRRVQPLLDTKASIEHKYEGVVVAAIRSDIVKKEEVEQAFSKSLNGEKIHVLVSNAAMIGPQDSVKDVNTEGFLDAIRQNLEGSLNIAKAFMNHMAPEAVVVEVNSSAAHVNFGSGFAAYSVAKLAVYRLWDSVAFANPRLNLFHLQPGVIETDMNKEAGGVTAAGFADDVSLPATFNVWLASSEARFLKGKYLWSNWDVDELKARKKEIESSSLLNIGLGGWPFGEIGWSFQAVAGTW